RGRASPGAAPPRAGVVEARATEIEAAEPIEAVAPPSPVVDLVAHRFAELAITGHIDADGPLLAHHVRHRRLEVILEAPVVGCLPGVARPIGLDQVVGTREAAGVAGQDMVVARAHGLS